MIGLQGHVGAVAFKVHAKGEGKITCGSGEEGARRRESKEEKRGEEEEKTKGEPDGALRDAHFRGETCNLICNNTSYDHKMLPFEPWLEGMRAPNVKRKRRVWF